jgi:hypothetical protein
MKIGVILHLWEGRPPVVQTTIENDPASRVAQIRARVIEHVGVDVRVSEQQWEMELSTLFTLFFTYIMLGVPFSQDLLRSLMLNTPITIIDESDRFLLDRGFDPDETAEFPDEN